ncbi:hypothetical protein HAX54_049229 [Datura stramonium]|uniref:Uncharacterized protein n=1 Tax=Datura stramonium TaxID=4076 RepID=A0ABS8RQW1_DATST|nr:hypothetical protein [Datura stramonium]
MLAEFPALQREDHYIEAKQVLDMTKMRDETNITIQCHLIISMIVGPIMSLLDPSPLRDPSPHCAPSNMPMEGEKGETNKDDVEEEDGLDMLVEDATQIFLAKKESMMDKGFYPHIEKEFGISVAAVPTTPTVIPDFIVPQND